VMTKEQGRGRGGGGYTTDWDFLLLGFALFNLFVVCGCVWLCVVVCGCVWLCGVWCVVCGVWLAV
jgi:hypothetical protein